MAAEGSLAVLIFEGGRLAQSDVEADFGAIREAVALDAVERVLGLQPGGLVDRVLLITNRPALARAAESLGAEADLDPSSEPFRFSARLTSLVRREGLGRVLVFGGGSAPLVSAAQWAAMARTLREHQELLLVNNPVSPDIIGLVPADRLLSLPAAGSDNALGRLLLGAGLPKKVLEPVPEVNFDLDTPTDCAVLAWGGEAGPRARRALLSCPWVANLAERVRRLSDLLARANAEVAVIGRAGPPATSTIEDQLPCRLRVISEQRGMRAQGVPRRMASLVGSMLDELGPERFMARLAAIVDAVVWDTRVLFAHWGGRVTRADRFRADVGRVDEIADPTVARFAAAVWRAPLLALLGGHSLVHGGLWYLAERAAARRG